MLIYIDVRHVTFTSDCKYTKQEIRCQSSSSVLQEGDKKALKPFKRMIKLSGRGSVFQNML